MNTSQEFVWTDVHLEGVIVGFVLMFVLGMAFDFVASRWHRVTKAAELRDYRKERNDRPLLPPLPPPAATFYRSFSERES